MKLAAIQYQPPKGDPERARGELDALIDEAAGRGAELVVLPEMATTGYVWNSRAELMPHAEVADGPTAAWLQKKAQQHKLWIVCGYVERALHAVYLMPEPREVNRLYNSALVVNPKGERLASYRKVLLFELDRSWATPGARRLIVDSEHGRLVPAICMDLNDNGFVHFLHRAEATVLPFCTNWLDEPGTDLHRYWRSRLDGWQGWMVAANSWGLDGDTRFAGRSAILAPGGEVVVCAGEEGNQVIIFDTADHAPRPGA